MTYTFKDFYQNVVQLSFEREPFTANPKHVWIICKYENQWLLTQHPTRGIEFPGGKVEAGETAEEAAVREVMEETGGTVKRLDYVAQYYVDGKRDSIFKNVYYGEIDVLTAGHLEYETLGPILLNQLPANLKDNEQYSFMMKDNVLFHCLNYLKKSKKLPN